MASGLGILSSYPRFMIVADSGTISAVAYNPETKELLVEFKATKIVWQYDHVYPADFGKLASAYSPGAVFNEIIRNKFPAQQVVTLPGHVSSQQ